jgi:hypothetical protein
MRHLAAKSRGFIDSNEQCEPRGGDDGKFMESPESLHGNPETKLRT